MLINSAIKGCHISRARGQQWVSHSACSLQLANRNDLNGVIRNQLADYTLLPKGKQALYHFGSWKPKESKPRETDTNPDTLGPDKNV